MRSHSCMRAREDGFVRVHVNGMSARCGLREAVVCVQARLTKMHGERREETTGRGWPLHAAGVDHQEGSFCFSEEYVELNDKT